MFTEAPIEVFVGCRCMVLPTSSLCHQLRQIAQQLLISTVAGQESEGTRNRQNETIRIMASYLQTAYALVPTGFTMILFCAVTTVLCHVALSSAF